MTKEYKKGGKGQEENTRHMEKSRSISRRGFSHDGVVSALASESRSTQPRCNGSWVSSFTHTHTHMHLSPFLYRGIVCLEINPTGGRGARVRRGVKRSARIVAFRRRWPFVCEMYLHSITFGSPSAHVNRVAEARPGCCRPRYPG